MLIHCTKLVAVLYTNNEYSEYLIFFTNKRARTFGRESKQGNETCTVKTLRNLRK